jgi:hypothetical protein
MRVDGLPAGLIDSPGRAGVTGAAEPDVSLRHQALECAALGELLALHQVKGELEGWGGSEPSLEQGEFDVSRWSERRRGYHYRR